MTTHPDMRPEGVAARCRENLAAVRGRVAEACRRAGRDPDCVTVIGVTKYGDAALAAALVEAGCGDLAESRPQAIWDKATALAGAGLRPRWHLVGHLQRNKVRRTLPVLDLLHTLDSGRLLATIDAEAAVLGRTCAVLVEVNLAGDPQRSGAPESDLPALVADAVAAPHVRLRGLMGMARHPDATDADPRRDFARLRDLRDRLARDLPPSCLGELSMGMTGDFEDAILEGATMVRIGSALVEGIAPC